MKKFPVENIFLFGESIRDVVPTDLDCVVANPTNEFHLLRHFMRTTKEYERTLLGQPYEYYDPETKVFKSSTLVEHDLAAAYQTTGTKFYPGVSGLETPRRLITLIRHELSKRVVRRDMHWIVSPHRQVLQLSLSCPEAVGDQDLVVIEDLPVASRERVQRVVRGGHAGERATMIQTVTGIAKQSTRNIAVEIQLVRGRSTAFLTAYPGELSPSFPANGQDPEEYGYNKSFWDQRAFIVA